jgi:hypothetical protein
MEVKIKAICMLILIIGTVASVSAHGVDITPQSTIVIADNSSGVLAKKVVDEMGVNATVYKFTSDDEVAHQLEHALSNPNKRILAVAYQSTVSEFIANNSNVSDRVLVCSADEMDIKNGLTLLTSNNTSGGFAMPFASGLLVGIMGGLAGGAFWVKRKNS